MKGLMYFLGSTAGRWVRGLAGLALILVGFFLLQDLWRWVLIIVGAVPLLAGLFDFCVFAPLAGLPFNGPRLRKEQSIDRATE